MALLLTDKFQYWLKTGASVFTRVTEDTAFDPKTNRKQYETNYKDRINQSIHAISQTTTISFDIDLADSGALQTYLEANEDAMNVATEVVRVAMHRPALPAWAATTAYALGVRIIADSKIYECTTAGTSGASAPTWPATGTVTDGTTLVWTYVSASTGYVIGTAGYSAKKAAFVMNQDPHDGDAADRLRARGELTMTDIEWTAGTFDPATATFTPAA